MIDDEKVGRLCAIPTVIMWRYHTAAATRNGFLTETGSASGCGPRPRKAHHEEVAAQERTRGRPLPKRKGKRSAIIFPCRMIRRMVGHAVKSGSLQAKHPREKPVQNVGRKDSAVLVSTWASRMRVYAHTLNSVSRQLANPCTALPNRMMTRIETHCR